MLILPDQLGTPGIPITYDYLLKMVEYAREQLVFDWGDDCKMTEQDKARFKACYSTLQERGKITKANRSHREWLGSCIVVRLVEAIFREALESSPYHSWDKTLWQAFTIVLQAALGSRIGDISYNQQNEFTKDDVSCLRYRDIDVRFVEASESLGPAFPNGRFLATFRISSGKGAKEGASIKIRTKELFQHHDPRYAAADPLNLLLVLALRTGNIRGVRYFDDLLSQVRNSASHRVVWLDEERPALCAPTVHVDNTVNLRQLDPLVPADYKQCATNLRDAAKLAGLVANVTTHDLRRGTAQDLMTLESATVRNDIFVAEVLDHSDAARMRGVTKLYERTDGHGNVWGQRLEQHGSVGSPFDPIFAASSYEPPKQLSKDEVDAAMVLHGKLNPGSVRARTTIGAWFRRYHHASWIEEQKQFGDMPQINEPEAMMTSFNVANDHQQSEFVRYEDFTIARSGSLQTNELHMHPRLRDLNYETQLKSTNHENSNPANPTPEQVHELNYFRNAVGLGVGEDDDAYIEAEMLEGLLHDQRSSDSSSENILSNHVEPMIFIKNFSIINDFRRTNSQYYPASGGSRDEPLMRLATIRASQAKSTRKNPTNHPDFEKSSGLPQSDELVDQPGQVSKHALWTVYTAEPHCPEHGRDEPANDEIVCEPTEDEMIDGATNDATSRSLATSFVPKDEIHPHSTTKRPCINAHAGCKFSTLHEVLMTNHLVICTFDADGTNESIDTLQRPQDLVKQKQRLKCKYSRRGCGFVTEDAPRATVQDALDSHQRDCQHEIPKCKNAIYGCPHVASHGELGNLRRHENGYCRYAPGGTTHRKRKSSTFACRNKGCQKIYLSITHRRKHETSDCQFKVNAAKT